MSTKRIYILCVMFNTTYPGMLNIDDFNRGCSMLMILFASRYQMRHIGPVVKMVQTAP